MNATKKLRNKSFSSNLCITEMLRQRVNMPSTKYLLKQNFNIENADLSEITRPSFLKEFGGWDEYKKHKFLVMIGGHLYYEKTKQYIETLQRKYNS